MSTQAISLWQRSLTRLHEVNRVALQWRLLLLWAVAILLPTALLAVPFWQALSALLDQTVSSAQWAQQLNGLVLIDVIGRLMENRAALANAGLAALLLTLLLSPLVNGAVVAAHRANKPLPFAALLAGAGHTYGRMVRMLLWGIVPLGIAGGISTGVSELAKKYEAIAILEANADLATHAAAVIGLVLLLLAQLTLDCGRAQLAAYPKRTSAIKAWWRGCRLLKAQFGSALVYFLSLTALGLVLAAAITALRIALPQLGVGWFVLGVVLTELAVIAVGWMRIARLVALIDLSHRHRAKAGA